VTNSLHDLVVLSDSVSLSRWDCREIIPTLGKADAVSRFTSQRIVSRNTLQHSI
jgi:hypothetical protein